MNMHFLDSYKTYILLLGDGRYLLPECLSGIEPIEEDLSP